ncbi:hypothetical protein CAOG_05746 [Capsaspora owczarzaki ATCC 30864]|uniref:Uncharacterized protein n=1 Tax=Capsaspora owczarzaki (strain ATCC 30864) TaxID=595528 RepID=A0A0D2X416_CAPO3|nr:hypothetical protein CAOG_05746 [Capsaspora owczarzaki ATCC 30864]KJE95274.1 hypothetical protein CAOG_005746 [Capsaspora owczarzaki ATCC 30864]|eukprot:XP_004346419.1 hypothetical protein CAOG_05746 [Capsaspora owczarzaki ATCC 30864]
MIVAGIAARAVDLLPAAARVRNHASIAALAPAAYRAQPGRCTDTFSSGSRIRAVPSAAGRRGISSSVHPQQAKQAKPAKQAKQATPLSKAPESGSSSSSSQASSSQASSLQGSARTKQKRSTLSSISSTATDSTTETLDSDSTDSNTRTKVRLR